MFSQKYSVIEVFHNIFPLFNQLSMKGSAALRDNIQDTIQQCLLTEESTNDHSRGKQNVMSLYAVQTVHHFPVCHVQ